MKTDLYTKAVLTTIAACLLCMVFRDQPIVATAQAQGVGSKAMDVNVVAISGQRVTSTYDGEAVLPVKLMNK